MSDQGNIFNQDPQKTTNEDPTVDPSIDPTKTDPSYDFIGEGKKYKNVEDALKSVPHAQAHIDRLEEELSTLREQAAKSKTIDEVLEKIDATKTSEQAHQQVQELDVDEIIKRAKEGVVNDLSAQEVAAKEQANVDVVINKMSEVYGEKAEEAFIKAAQDSGLTVEAMNKLAAQSPSAVFKLTGVGSKTDGTPVPSNGSVNTDSFNNGQDEDLNIKVPTGATSKDLTTAWLNAGKSIQRS